MTDADLLDQLDRQWLAGGPADLRALLNAVSPDDDESSRELCAADLEWRWRVATERNAGDFPARPRGHDYADLLADHWHLIQCKRDLLEAEWCARCVWGDAPDVDQFASRLPTIENWTSHLIAQLQTLVPWSIDLSSSSLKRPMRLTASGDFVIGRQGAKEPAAPAWSAKTSRLIIANAHYRVISREQLRVRRTRTRQLQLTNVSKTTLYRSEDIRLQPGESTQVEFPCTLSVGELDITIDLRDPPQYCGNA